MLRMFVVLSTLPTQLRAIAREIRKDSSGAALVEYSMLIAMIAALVIAFVIGVGQFVNSSWNFLCANLLGAGLTFITMKC